MGKSKNLADLGSHDVIDTSSAGMSVTGTVTATDFAGDGSGLTGVDSFKPVAVSGATQALNVGSYNFFNAGSLTANTTVSFTSVPTNARWSYSFEPSVVPVAWDITEAIYLQSYSESIGSAPSAIFFKPDGTKMYTLDYAGRAVSEHDLNVAWSVSTGSWQQSFDVSSKETRPMGLFFKPDGTEMYVVGDNSDNLHQYSLSTAWDISTASFLQSLSVVAQDTFPKDVFFKPDGLRLYIVGSDGNDVAQRDLTTAWDISTTNTSFTNFLTNGQESDPEGVSFKADGTKMYVVGAGDVVYEYNLSTAWDVTTASYLQSLNASSGDSDQQGITFKPDGTKMYLIGNQQNQVDEYNLGPTTTLTLPSSVSQTTSALSGTSRVTYEFFTTDGGTTVTLIGEEVI
jgi:sugar lactone lactonase YvrE